MHDFLTVGAAAPLQAAGAVALALPDSYYDAAGRAYRERRDLLLARWRAPASDVTCPDGAYYVMTDIPALTDEDDVTFCARA